MEKGMLVLGLVAIMVVGVVVVVESSVEGEEVSYDGRSLIINGQRKLLFSASIHYPRSTPEMWGSLIGKAKEGGIDVIQTYVFWNLHEPEKGQYDFSGRDIVRFIKEIQAHGLYASLRIGPFIEAEWNYGGLPFWLHDVPGIVYRCDNEPFKVHMQNFTTKIVNMMKSENLYASQGGPIILSQIENEYEMVEHAFHEKGPPYVRWAAQMAVALQTGVPWMMCKQYDAPDPVVIIYSPLHLEGRLAINFSRHKIHLAFSSVDQHFPGPNSPNKPWLWTENWTTWYRAYGKEPETRSAQDIAFQVALFVARNGTFVNYYMYHGGTNFGRTTSAFTTTSYYDDAPLDEYGFIRLPKWGHLKQLHEAIKSCSNPILFGTQFTLSLGQQQMGYIYQRNSGECAAFLVNQDDTKSVAVIFPNSSYELGPSSVSILPDCKNVVFNTAKVNVKNNTRLVTTGKKFNESEMWQEFKDIIPTFADTSMRSKTLLEHMNTTKDMSDYLWYTFSYQHESSNSKAVLSVRSAGHVLHAFVNGASVGAFLERKALGLRRVRIHDIQNSKDLSNHRWGYQVGLLGEKLQIYMDHSSSNVQWRNFTSSNNPLTWYKVRFDAPAKNESFGLNLGSMGKGEVWINGQSIGRHWASFLTSQGSPYQTWYHVPRSFLKPKDNLLVILEEQNGSPLGISLDIISTI
ncbi:hypothetical protein ES319_D05G264200v1 [Gossypium barbadense]|uniref:Beta-galactosidase n=1 Tax=Gossypium barbadense TaxID=3634 RepID=A0A5J5RI18_GOSBA|nr:hypothetical protein ES319_D05G264200v1 [Gossypium barbadense]